MLLDQVYKTERDRLVESYVYGDPLFEQWNRAGCIIAERKMTEPEILDLFGKIESGMTNKDTGANRTWMGRGKDTAGKAYTSVKDALNSVMSSIQNSAPVQAVDVAYDQATDAVAKLGGGENSKVMQAIKGYRNLVKEYPKASGFAKAALVAIAGLATGGAGLPAIAGLTYALDSAIRGDKLSSVLGKGAGAAAVTWAGQAASDALKSAPATDSSVSASDSLSPGEEIVGQGAAGAAGETGKLNSWSQGVGPGDTLSGFAKKYNVSVDELLKANPQITNPDVLQVGSSIQIPTNNFQGDQWGSGLPVYDKGVGTSADTMAKIKTGQYTDSPISQALAKKLKESANFKLLPIDKLIDQKLTVMNWALTESVGKGTSRSVNLTTLGAYTVFENVNRYAKAVVKEADVGPGRPNLPDEFRPDMPGGSGGYDKSKKGVVGKGLDWINKAAGKVGGALSNFGHQFTTKVTKEKLKMDWHQAGKPSDSDALAAFLVKQGVPQQVVNDVYGSMGIPATATSTSAAPAAAAAGGAQTSMPFYGVNPATKKPWTADELQAKAGASASTAPATAGGATPAKAPATAPATAPGKSFALPQATSASAVGMPSKVTYGKGFEKKPATTQFPAFGTARQAAGYSYKTPGASTAPTLPKPTTTKISPSMPAAPSNPVTAGAGGTYDKKTGAANLGGKSMVAMKDLPPAVQKKLEPQLAESVNKMLESVKNKKDVEAIRKYIDTAFSKVKLSEHAINQRKKLMDHVTKVSAIRRRLHASTITK